MGVTAIRTLVFVVPAIILGIILSKMLLGWLSHVIKDDSGGASSGYAMIEALTLGVMVPVISSIRPMLEAMR